MMSLVLENGATEETLNSICNFQVSKICKKKVHRNDKKKLP